MVTWGTSPEQALPVTAAVPDPRDAKDEAAGTEIAAALEYMALEPGTLLTDIQVDRVFIGSCTNSRIEDLRAAAEVARLGRARIPPGWCRARARCSVRPSRRAWTGSSGCGFEWREPGCSLCTALNGDQLRPGERCASTSNRNFRGRQGTGGRTHLLSPRWPLPPR
jgi:3-isopropylmalate/(R)-2-methylmalate dehydratase large subunit